jgi:AraC-like DNA-binding protein
MPLQLASFPIISTEDTDEAESVLSREMASLRFLKVSKASRFRLTMNGVRLGRTLLGWNRFDTEMEIEAGRIEDAIVLTLSVGPPTIPVIDGEPVRIGRGAVTSPSRHVAIHRAAGSEILILRTNIQAIEQRFHEVVERRPDRPFVFDPSIDLGRGVGAEIQRLLKVTLDQIGRDGSVLQFPLLRKSLDDLLLSALLTLPNTYSSLLADCGERPFAPRLVRMAEEYMEAHGSQPIDLSEVAKVCNCSRRTLFAAFRRHRDYTPAQFLGKVRLKLARESLQSPKADDTVATIAHRCGFFHAGRFAKICQERFGESPSQTLRRSRTGR